MWKKFSEKRRGEAEGFTLVELLIVIVILGILAAIVVFAVGGITDKGTSASCSTDASVLQAAEEAYFAKFSVYTADEQDLVKAGLVHSASSKHNVTLVTGVTGSVDSYSLPGLGGCPDA